MFVVGVSVGLDFWIPMMDSARASAAVCIFFPVGFLVNTLREWGPRRMKCGFHNELSPLGMGLFVGAGWLAYVAGLRLGVVRHRRGLQSALPSKAVAPSRRFENSLDLTLTCCITCERLVDPVLAPDGHTYERAALEQWLKQSRTSPMTGEPMPEGELRTSYAMRSLLNLTSAEGAANP